MKAPGDRDELDSGSIAFPTAQTEVKPIAFETSEEIDISASSES